MTKKPNQNKSDSMLYSLMEILVFVVLLGSSMLLVIVLNLDALEFELTGSCKDCMILPLIKPGMDVEG